MTIDFTRWLKKCRSLGAKVTKTSSAKVFPYESTEVSPVGDHFDGNSEVVGSVGNNSDTAEPPRQIPSQCQKRSVCINLSDFASIFNVRLLDSEKNVVAEHFTSITNCHLLDVDNSGSDSFPPGNFMSLDNVTVEERKIRVMWDWLLFFSVIFSMLSTYALIWAKGLGILTLSEGDLRLYFVGWLSQIVALVVYRMRSLFRLGSKKEIEPPDRLGK